jgi:hypothetical protein
MKKLIAIAVLLVLLTAAVFAQDEGWKFGLMAQHTSDLLWATSMSGKSELSNDGSTVTQEFGGLNKGSFNFFNGRNAPTHDNRLLFKISHTGESHEVYADIRMDGWEKFKDNKGVLGLLESGCEDWYAKGNAGIFNGQIGTAGYGGFVSTQATWNDYLGWNELCRFGVWRAEEGFLVGDDFRTWSQWGTILALGAGFGDFKFSIGHRLDPDYSFDNAPPSYNDPTDSKSSINASFMFSGRPIDLLTFDLFYSVIGKDTDTFARTEAGHSGEWGNIIGAYVGLNVVENLGLSLGYTANFTAYDKGAYADDGDLTKSKPVTYTAPIYSGVDLRVNYSGIDKIGLTFNNNLSFAGVKGKEIKADSDEIILNFSGKPYDKDLSQDWFHWDAELKASLSLVDNLSLTAHLGNRLAVLSEEDSTSSTTIKSTTTDNELRVAVNAEYGIGTVTVGTGVFFSVLSKTVKYEAGSSTYDGNTNVVSFGIPILFKVAF